MEHNIYKDCGAWDGGRKEPRIFGKLSTLIAAFIYQSTGKGTTEPLKSVLMTCSEIVGSLTRDMMQRV